MKEKLLCNHEKRYCRSRESKFFKNSFGELVAGSSFGFNRHFKIEDKRATKVFRNRGIEEEKEFEKILEESFVSPEVSDISDSDWRGEYGVFWI